MNESILKKGVQIGVLGAALTAGAVMGTGCAQPEDDEQTIIQEIDVNQNSQPYDKTIGNGNYNIHNFMGENPTFVGADGLTGSATVVKNVNYYLTKAETYTKDLATKFDQSLNGRPAAQDYFRNLTNAMKNNNHFSVNQGSQNNFDSAVIANFAAGKSIFTDIIKNLNNTDERYAFQYCYRILANETYKEGLGNSRNYANPSMDNYNHEKNELIDSCYDNEYLKDIGLANIYAQNDLRKFNPITDFTDRLLGKFVKNINAKRNLGLQVSDMQQFINISLTLNSLGAMHDYSKGALQHNNGCLIGKGIGFYDYTMYEATNEAWKEEQQYQQAYQDYMSR